MDRESMGQRLRISAGSVAMRFITIMLPLILLLGIFTAVVYRMEIHEHAAVDLPDASAVMEVLFLFNAFMLVLLSAGALVLARAHVLRDLTARELRKLSRAVEQSPVSIMITDTAGVIEYVNPKFIEVTGYGPEEVIGKTAAVLNAGMQTPEFYRDLWDTIRSGREWRGELANRRKNGDIFWESATISAIRDRKDGIIHFVAVKEDISKHKKIERELQAARQAADKANRSKGEFLSAMSHEIRTPLNAVIGMTHLLAKTELSGKQADYLRKIQSSAKVLLMLINDILDFSRIEADALELEHAEFMLDEVLDDIVGVNSPLAQAKGLKLTCSLDRRVPVCLVGDSLRLGQVLNNLVGNAVKFTEAGEILVEVGLEAESDLLVTLRFSVRDSGVGMTGSQQARLFEAFKQAEIATARQHGGSGLGLCISKRLVEMMGGRIWVRSEYGAGSTLFFTAEFGRGVRRGSAARHVSVPVAVENVRGARVLLVEDNEINQQVALELLERIRGGGDGCGQRRGSD